MLIRALFQNTAVEIENPRFSIPGGLNFTGFGVARDLNLHRSAMTWPGPAS